MKTATGAYLKKDKYHDVLGNLINPPKLDIPEKVIKSMTIKMGGRDFFWIPDKGNLQCAKCLYVMKFLAYPDDGSPKRKFYIEDDCRCSNPEKYGAYGR